MSRPSISGPAAAIQDLGLGIDPRGPISEREIPDSAELRGQVAVDELTPGLDAIRAAHITELRAAVLALE